MGAGIEPRIALGRSAYTLQPMLSKIRRKNASYVPSLIEWTSNDRPELLLVANFVFTYQANQVRQIVDFQRPVNRAVELPLGSRLFDDR